MPATEGVGPFFSIIVPTFNRALLLDKALNSILAQEFSDFEIIVVDDGSTDNTRNVVLNVQERAAHVKYFFKRNEERSIARNFGITKAAGRYIGFLDSDDTLYPNHLLKAHELLTRNNFPEVGHLGYKIINTTGDTLSTRSDFDQSFKEKLIHENIMSMNAIFIRKDIAMEVNFIPSSAAILSEDWYLWLRLASRYEFHFDNVVTSSVVQHDERSLKTIDPDKLIASTNIVVEYLRRDEKFLRQYKDKAAYHFANHYTFLALTLALTKTRRRETIAYLFTAMRYDPAVVLRVRFLATIKHWF